MTNVGSGYVTAWEGSMALLPPRDQEPPLAFVEHDRAARAAKQRKRARFDAKRNAARKQAQVARQAQEP